MISLVGTIEQYNPKTGNFEEYKERMEQYFLCNDVPDDRKVPLFLTLIGGQTYSILKDLSAPTSPANLSYKEMVDKLSQHFSPVRITIAERYKFHSANQNEAESVGEFIVRIRNLASTCSFGTFWDDACRDKLVCGLRRKDIQKKLLSTKSLTFEMACTDALAMELAEQQAKSMDHGFVNKFNQKSRDTTRNKYQSSGSSSGSSSQSRIKHQSQPSQSQATTVNWECYACKRKGHTSTVCRNKTYGAKAIEENSTEEVQSEEELLSGDLYPLAHVQELHKVECPCITTLLVEGKSMKFEIDTGACKTIIPVSIFDTKFKDLKLRKAGYRLNVVTGQEVTALGEIQVNAVFKKKMLLLPITVINSEKIFIPLLGRNWLDVLWPEWQRKFCVVNQVKCDKSTLATRGSYETLIKKRFEKVFDGNLLSCINDVCVSLILKVSQPIFRKAYSMPYALKPKVEAKLKAMVSTGILERVEFSNWASPIVVVPKKDGEF
ncbi:uncharacterized protein K02A2.6-like [Photinus pyralis]|uniref:uncharacterized protein K02A2.6-like n=1 Tax=Photinus pyralis TaxID=7054 RepID=UPI0012675F1F|nr:uncharacterized protein K02A2.6-like [Photinus pyralis]